MLRWRNYCLGLAVMASLAGATSPASAQDNYPSRTVTVIVDRSPGGGTDITARLVAQHLTKALGQNFVVVNRDGAAGKIALQYVHGAKPDGYTLEVVGSGYTILPAMYNMGFDLVGDMTPVAELSEGGLLLVANPKLGVKSVSELVALAKKDPGKISSATVGKGSISDLSTALLAKLAGIKLNSVQYKGAGPAMIDTMAGTVDILFSSPQNAIPQVKAGALVVLGTTATVPMQGLSDVASISKSVPGFEIVEWYGMIGPKDLPPDIVKTLSDAINKILKEPDVMKNIETQGMVAAGGTPDHFRSLLENDVTRRTAIAKEIGIQQQ